MNLMDLFIKIGVDDQASPAIQKISADVKVGMLAAAKFGKDAVVEAGRALFNVTKSALDATGELEQNIGGSEAVFGKYAKNVQGLAEDAYSNMGVSASDFLATANKMGSLMQGSGISIEDSMKMSTEAMQRAADVAAIMGIDVGSAMESIAGAAKGNFTMMDNLGVAMNATTIESYALSKGITTAYKEMDNATKIGLAMEMFLEKTEYATGRYAEENETLAGSMTTLQASWDNFLSGAGDIDQVLESAGGAGEAVVRTLGDVIPRIGDGIETVVQSVGEKVPGIIENVSANFPNLMNMVTEKFGEGVNLFVTNLPTMFSNLLGGASGLIETFSTVGVDFINGMVTGITDSIPDFVAGLPDIIGEFGGFIATNAPKLVDAGMEIMTNLTSGLADAVSELTDKAPELIAQFGEALGTASSQLSTAAGEIMTSIAEGLGAATGDVISACGEIIDLIIEQFSSITVPVGLELVFSSLGGLKNAAEAYTNFKDTKAAKSSGSGGVTVNQFINKTTSSAVEIASASKAYLEQTRWGT